MQKSDQFAVIRSGGRQYKAIPGQKLTVELARDSIAQGKVKVGDQIVFSDVLMICNSDGTEAQIGNPLLGSRSVTAKVAAIRKGPKLIVFKKRRRQRYVKKNGYRGVLTDVLVDKIS